MTQGAHAFTSRGGEGTPDPQGRLHWGSSPKFNIHFPSVVGSIHASHCQGIESCSKGGQGVAGPSAPPGTREDQELTSPTLCSQLLG